MQILPFPKNNSSIQTLPKTPSLGYKKERHPRHSHSEYCPQYLRHWHPGDRIKKNNPAAVMDNNKYRTGSDKSDQMFAH
jgi:hypothetical protein